MRVARMLPQFVRCIPVCSSPLVCLIRYTVRACLFPSAAGKVKCAPEHFQTLQNRQQHFRDRVAEQEKHPKNDEDEQHVPSGGSRKAFGEVRKTKRGRAANNRPALKNRGALKAVRRTDDKGGNAGKLEVFHDPEGACTYSAGHSQPSLE